MEFKDYYAILGVSRDASKDEVKGAYRRLARKYHPDVSSEHDAEARFKEVSEAYEVLQDPEKRRAYDELGANWKQGHDFRPPPDWAFHGQGDGRGGQWTGQVDLGEFSDFFSSLFGGAAPSAEDMGSMRGRGRSNTTSARSAEISIELEEAFHGCLRDIRIRDPRGGLRTGRMRIPAGVTEGQRLRVPASDSSDPLTGGAANTLVTVRIKDHRLYRLEGRDVRLDLPVMPWELALGATVEVPTLGGTLEVRIPSGSRSGQTLRLRGRGLPGSPAGDQLVILEVVVPAAKNDRIRAAYEQLRDAVHDDPRASMKP